MFIGSSLSAVDEIMSKKGDASFLCENKECKCPPQHIPWSNPNEVQASQRMSGARFRDYPHESTIKHDEDKKGIKRHKHDNFNKFSMESSQRRKRHQKIAEKDKPVAMKETVLFEQKEKVKEANPTGNIAYSSSLYELWARNENEHGAQGPVADNGIGTKNRGTAGGRRVMSHSRGPDISPGSEAFPRQAHNHHITEEIYPGAVRVAGLDSAEGYEEDELTLEIGYEEQATVANREESTVHITAQVVDTEEENWRFHQQERVRLERDQFLRERNQLRRIMDNAVVVDPVVVTDRDVQNTNEEVCRGATNDGKLLENNGCKCGTRGMRWLAIGVILLIVVALVVALAIVLQSPDDPTRPPDPLEIPCDEMADGSFVCYEEGYPADGFTLDYLCPASASTTADCTACAIITSDSATQCNSCTLCSDYMPAFDCSNVADGDCVTSDCDGNCYGSSTGTDPPTPPDPDPTDPPEDEITCDEMPDGSLVCPVADFPADGFTLDYLCPASASTTADCTACAIIAPDGATQCNSCTLCFPDTIPAAFDCSNVAEGDCVTMDCEGTCYPGDTGNSTAVRALLNIFYTFRGWRG